LSAQALRDASRACRYRRSWPHRGIATGHRRREPGVSLRGAEADPQLQLGDEGAVPATKADAPLVVADNEGLKNNRTWSPNSYKNNNWNKNWNKNGNWNNNAYWNKKYPNKHWNKKRVYVRTWKPSTASSSAASFWARS
jgi:hypothetical protein